MRKIAVEYSKKISRSACPDYEKVVQFKRINDALVQACIKGAYMAGKAQKPIETVILNVHYVILNAVKNLIVLSANPKRFNLRYKPSRCFGKPQHDTFQNLQLFSAKNGTLVKSAASAPSEVW